ncbi:MAG: D-tyrosyl-tRNA(Tyr) deacylase [Pseudodesulfovibrio sp.]|uniref:D-aminoacyl-tRNA deacylase n=1 Tax=Pseudodesulfovibrio aespoeensis (strain ATCC 700646 / DSM 10631 / Aspo-2) TaxID=643562 RepID=E6VYW5_PSEA9|nr:MULTISPECIES: D-aminoacyl-tRNA deacylase [Pseudodesulfovibrio]MBU4192376.1 D-tyrosyl-tRNA(Tyr) deacylase [Pseudomonadota bacterium]MCG2733441.1 D-aminoacyl-tRNA deacylase [Pseudodesulfovibrio aespoeensis]ADU61628.1 D-tyrosyl-tRNA(Tyr) deacylase [Pseudodesulfovibrio aespoeensis Aspo-2]MBU4243157.1 D-tyrosyl-tRNA(Tyr) deacylase [Pseudomonadota bacterium]MBU4378181.1 D-tyrosyl-tRNA(Tyr) deacylase [Pseudomonadota bacterium]
MRLVIQRVTEAAVLVGNAVVGEIETGLLALVGFGSTDTGALPGSPVWRKTLDKLVGLRIFPDDQGRFNRSLVAISGDLLLVSQFTLYADCRKGCRPSFTGACPPDLAAGLFDRFVADARACAPGRVACGEFGADMRLRFTNWGPVTITLDSDQF